MAKHPDNPYWHQDHDKPIMILSRADWNRAVDAGHLTPDHVLLRLKNIADHAFGNETVMGFDDEGFATSLIAEGLPLPSGVTLYVYASDHLPPHVHIKLRSHPNARLRVRLDTGDFLDDAPRGVSTKKLKGFQDAVRENHDVLAGWWKAHQGGPVVVR